MLERQKLRVRSPKAAKILLTVLRGRYDRVVFRMGYLFDEKMDCAIDKVFYDEKFREYSRMWLFRDRSFWMAEREGFEPSVPFWSTNAFQAFALDHYATSPK